MKVVNTVQELKAELAAFRSEGKKIGLVPTMGALHVGHASLVGRSVKENDVTVVSVFVNPTQFNDKKDLETYPRTLEADCRLKIGKLPAFPGERDFDPIAFVLEAVLFSVVENDLGLLVFPREAKAEEKGRRRKRLGHRGFAYVEDGFFLHMLSKFLFLL